MYTNASLWCLTSRSAYLRGDHINMLREGTQRIDYNWHVQYGWIIEALKLVAFMLLRLEPKTNIQLSFEVTAQSLWTRHLEVWLTSSKHLDLNYCRALWSYRFLSGLHLPFKIKDLVCHSHISIIYLHYYYYCCASLSLKASSKSVMCDWMN